jgi:hypothetical protein
MRDAIKHLLYKQLRRLRIGVTVNRGFWRHIRRIEELRWSAPPANPRRKIVQRILMEVTM